MTANKTLSSKLLVGPLVVLLLFILAGCGDEAEVATVPTDEPVSGSPAAVNRQKTSAETVTITIRDGKFTDQEVILQQEEGSSITIDNRDATAYQFRIKGLVDAEAIPASGTTLISLTTPDPDRYTGELLDSDGNTVVAKISVAVQLPDGSIPE